MRTGRPLRGRVLAAAATTTLLAGCGDDETGKLGKAALAKRADAICAKYNVQQKALKPPTDVATGVAYFDKLIPIATEQDKELRGLVPADDVEAEWSGLLDGYEEILASAKQAGAALKAGDVSRYQTLAAATDVKSTASDKRFDALGARHCGSDDS